MPSGTTKSRLLHLWKKRAAILLVGLFYALFVAITGLYLPCPIRSFTGLLCPGCGISHAAMALLRLDVARALRWNPVLVGSAPLLLVLLLWHDWSWVKTGREPEHRAYPLLLWGLVVLLLVWGVVRNLPLP